MGGLGGLGGLGVEGLGFRVFTAAMRTRVGEHAFSNKPDWASAQIRGAVETEVWYGLSDLALTCPRCSVGSSAVWSRVYVIRSIQD